MMGGEEGYIKFRPVWKKQDIKVDSLLLANLNKVRSELKKRNWLGVLPNGIGFGNLSVRLNGNEFLITGSATGKFKYLNERHLSIVKKVDIGQNSLECVGNTVASAESMSHAACYLSGRDINAVIHIHDERLWQKHLHNLPTSAMEAEYGTPEMAKAISEIIDLESGILIMGGHKDGILAYGRSLEEAIGVLSKVKASPNPSQGGESGGARSGKEDFIESRSKNIQ